MPDIVLSTRTVEKRTGVNGTPRWNHFFHTGGQKPGVKIADEHFSSLIGIITPYEVLNPHFHLVDQFQVVVAGGGKLANHDVRPGSVHFTDANTPYGPLTAGPKGLWYFTLRSQTDNTHLHFMPESREELKGRKIGREVVADYYVNPGETLYLRESVCESLVAPHADGLAVSMVRAGPGATAQTPSAKGSGGQMVMIANGTARHEGNELPLFSVAWVGPDEGPMDLTGGGCRGWMPSCCNFPASGRCNGC